MIGRDGARVTFDRATCDPNQSVFAQGILARYVTCDYCCHWQLFFSSALQVETTHYKEWECTGTAFLSYNRS